MDSSVIQKRIEDFMIRINGTKASADIFTMNVEESALKQIENICENEVFEGQEIKIMPDCHSGNGCVIGFVSKYNDKITPNIVGCDIGCGMNAISFHSLKFQNNQEEFCKMLDSIVHSIIPSGFSINEKLHEKTVSMIGKSLYNGITEICDALIS